MSDPIAKHGEDKGEDGEEDPTTTDSMHRRYFPLPHPTSATRDPGERPKLDAFLIAVSFAMISGLSHSFVCGVRKRAMRGQGECLVPEKCSAATS